jgi:hypothetical protein
MAAIEFDFMNAMDGLSRTRAASESDERASQEPAEESITAEGAVARLELRARKTGRL